MNFQLQGGGVMSREPLLQQRANRLCPCGWHSGGYADWRQRGRWKFRQV